MSDNEMNPEAFLKKVPHVLLTEDSNFTCGCCNSLKVIPHGFKCSSGEVTNQFLDDIGRRIKREEGLESLEIEDYYD